MAFGQSPSTTTQPAPSANQIPVGGVYMPNEASTGNANAQGNLAAWRSHAAPVLDNLTNPSAAGDVGIADGDFTTFGAQADTAATTDTGTFSFMALMKRLLTKLPGLGQQTKANSMSVTVASDQGALSTSETNSAAIATNTASEVTNTTAISTTTGAKADAAATDSVSAWSVVALLKGILSKLLGSIAVTGTFWQATQPISAISLPLPIGAASSALQIAQKGALTTTAGATVANTAYSATFASQVNHVLLSNNTTANLNYEFENAATAGSDVLAPGQKLLMDVQCITVSLLTATIENVNGSAAANIVVRGWL